MDLNGVFKLDGFDYRGKQVEFMQPVSFNVKFDENTGMYYIKYSDLGICVFSEYKSYLEEMLIDELRNKWEWLVLCSNDTLCDSAKTVKYNFLNMVKEG